MSSSPTRMVGTEMTSTGGTMEMNDDNSVFNEAWEPLKTASSSHEVRSVISHCYSNHFTIYNKMYVA